MTRPEDRTTSANEQKAEARSQKPDQGLELDAEIVPDLELDEWADDVRGGGSTRTVG